MAEVRLYDPKVAEWLKRVADLDLPPPPDPDKPITQGMMERSDDWMMRNVWAKQSRRRTEAIAETTRDDRSWRDNRSYPKKCKDVDGVMAYDATKEFRTADCTKLPYWTTRVAATNGAVYDIKQYQRT